MQWFNSSNGKSYLYYSDAWIEVDSIGNSASSSGNVIINGGFEIYQRGAGSTNYINTNIYHPDRWGIFRAGFATGASGLQVSTGLTGMPFGHRVQRVSGNASGNFIMMGQPIETINSELLQGQTVTFSAWIRRGANFSGSSNNLTMNIEQGTGTNSTHWIGYNLTPINELKPITEGWVRHTLTGTISSTAKSIGVSFSYTPTGTAGANDWFEVTGVQLEAGTVATPFKRHSPSIQAEIAACQRYYFRHSIGTSTGAYLPGGVAVAITGTVLDIHIPHKVSMRSGVSSVETGLLGFYNWRTNGSISGGTIALYSGSTEASTIRYTHGSSVFNVNDNLSLVGTGGGILFIGLNAEL
jgi:hypothetical protein